MTTAAAQTRAKGMAPEHGAIAVVIVFVSMIGNLLSLVVVPTRGRARSSAG
jgi:hypothetical protein